MFTEDAPVILVSPCHSLSLAANTSEMKWTVTQGQAQKIAFLGNQFPLLERAGGEGAHHASLPALRASACASLFSACASLFSGTWGMLSLHAYSQTPCCLCLLHTHTRSEMPHCPSCNRHFARRDNLRRHLKGGYCRPTVWIPPASSTSSHPSGAGPAPEEYADEFHMEDDGGLPLEDVLVESDPFFPFWSELHAVHSSFFLSGHHKLDCDCSFFFLPLFLLLLLPPSGLQQWQ